MEMPILKWLSFDPRVSGGSRSLLDLLDSLECSVETQRRNNGDILQLAAMVTHEKNI